MADELKACPSCKSHATIEQGDEFRFYAVCSRCGMGTKLHNSEQQAANDWNVRAMPECVAALITRLEGLRIGLISSDRALIDAAKKYYDEV